jgi:hypothetical protein
VVDGRLEVREGEVPGEIAAGSAERADRTVDVVRAACAAAWDAVDGGAVLDAASVPELAVAP